MPRVQGLDRPVRLSVLDRLLGRQGDSGAPASTHDLREGVLRDLEWLLNTRRIAATVPDDFPETQRSLYHYGLPDITSLGRDAPDTRAKLAAQLEEAIEVFEPRLSQVRITLAKEAIDARRRIRFIIHATLAADPEPIRIAFDAAVDRTSGDIHVNADAA